MDVIKEVNEDEENSSSQRSDHALDTKALKASDIYCVIDGVVYDVH